MIVDIDEETLPQIQNPAFRKYASKYVDIYLDFLKQATQSGMEIDERDYSGLAKQKTEALGKRGVKLCNDRKSLRIGNVSPACVACQTGTGSATFFISLKCHRKCFYCFNPNQENYNYYRDNTRDVVNELQQIRAQKLQVGYLALTGGEPLLHKEDSVEFFRHAQAEFPDAHTRLYTSGDQVDADILRALGGAGLQEIRFSIRTDDLLRERNGIFKRIALARDFIPQVMVEMPVLPETQKIMQNVLLELDRIGLFSINLLEFCYPFNNPQAYQKRGYKIKKRPFRVLYNYWYAGGLPVSGSEQVCLDLLDFALDAGLSLGIHYCSVENKQTGQLYQQNSSSHIPPTAYFSPRDYLLKTAKVFGRDTAPVRALLERNGFDNYRFDPGNNILDFHVGQIKQLEELDVEIGISSGVIEDRGGESVLRELKVDAVSPKTFDLTVDV